MKIILLIMIMINAQLSLEESQTTSSLSIIIKKRNFNLNFTLDRFNLNQLLYSIDISNKCRTSVLLEERKCYEHFLNRYDGFEVKHLDNLGTVVVTSDTSTEFDRHVCCAIWRWYDCTTRNGIKHYCTMADYRSWATFPNEDNAVTYYCFGYEFGTYRCWYLPVWIYIVVALGTLLLISIGLICVIWYWKKGAKENIVHYRKKSALRTSNTYV